MKKKLFVFNIYMVFVTLLMSAGAWADEAAQKLVLDTTKQIINEIKKQRKEIDKNPAQLAKLVDKIVFSQFDFTKMSTRVLGKHWGKASDSQKTRFTEEFRHLLVRTYSKALLEGVDKEIKFLPLSGKSKKGRVTVRTEIEQSSGFPIPINYKLHKKDNAWKVYDVVIDGLSIVRNYRTTFAKKIRKEGIDKLIVSLAERNTEQKK
jgi:phospholipid transport system substrate-binding protein